jgi:hypothetical protein
VKRELAMAQHLLVGRVDSEVLCDRSDGEETSLVPSASAKLAVANFDAQGLAGTLEGVVRGAALSSAGNAVGKLSAVLMHSCMSVSSAAHIARGLTM